MGTRRVKRTRSVKSVRRVRPQPRQRGRGRFWAWAFWGMTVVAVLGLGLGVVLPQFGGGGQPSGPGEVIPDLGNEHIPSLDSRHQPYNSDPPTSGPHVGWIAAWGSHSEPIPRELQVHNLEDRGVMVQYRPDAPPEAVAALRAIVSQYKEGVILAPYPGLQTLIALTAWTRLERLETVDEARIKRFIDAYRGIDHHVRR